MYLVGLGVVLLAMKFLETGPVATWAWWVVLAPFGLAVAWWSWADASGYTKRKEMEREDAKRQARIDRNRDAMGLLSSKRKKK
jgi:small Trp-rich protein